MGWYLTHPRFTRCLPHLKEGITCQVQFLGGANSEFQFRSLFASLRFKVKFFKMTARNEEMNFIRECGSWSTVTWTPKNHCHCVAEQAHTNHKARGNSLTVINPTHH